jgi:peptidase M28-like protein
MRRPIVLLGLLLIAIIGLMAAKACLIQTPQLRAQPKAGEFDARRAKARLAVILGDQRPHPADTAGDDQVRARLTDQLEHLGLKPIVRDQLACNELYKARGVTCARVRNVIAVLGPASGKAVLVNAHYDSVPVGPGAADDGIGVATLLEVAANLKDQPLKRPVILLFNEGEELGLIGARAFLADPLSRNVDSLINLEARGVRGPVNMFETSHPNGAPIAVFAAAVKHPTANSLSTDVYRLLPNYTDVNSFSERGWLTLNLAPIGNETRYHSPGDDVAALDLRTLQHMGDQTLTLTQALANGTPKPSGDRIFMDVVGKSLITMPLAGGVILLVALLFGLGGIAWTRGEMLRGVSLVIGTLLLSAALSFVALDLVGIIHKGMFWRAHPIWTTLSTYASAMLVAVVLLATLGRRANLRQLRAAFWLVYVAIGAVIGLVAPGGIIFFLLPPLPVLAGMIGCRLGFPTERIGAVLAIIVLYLTWGAMLRLLEELLNIGPMWVFAPLGSLIILPILIEAKPLIDRVAWRECGAAAGVLAFAGWIVAAAAPAYSSDRQQRFVIEHVTDAGSLKSYWSILNDGAPLPHDFAGQWKRGTLPFSDRKRWLAAAPADPSTKAPDVIPISSLQNGDERTVIIRVASNGNERVELIAPEGAKIRSAGSQGFVRPIDQNENGKYLIDCFGRSCDGLPIELVVGKTTPIDWLIVGSSPGLPSAAAPLIAARPKFARPQYNRDESIVFARRKL